MGAPGIEAEGERLTWFHGEAARSPMERNVEPLDCCAGRVSRGELSSAFPVCDVPIPVGSPAVDQKDALDRITAYLEALGFRDATARHGLVQEILERLGPGSGNDPEETVEERAIRETLSAVDHRLARAPGLGGPRGGSMRALARAALGDPRVRLACLALPRVRHGSREYEIPFPGDFVAPPTPLSLPTSMPEQRLDMPSLKDLASGWRGWLRFQDALRNTLAKIPR